MHVLLAHNAYGRPSGEEHALTAIERLLVEHGQRVSRFERSSEGIRASAWQHVRAALAGIDNPFARREMAVILADLQPDVVLVQNLYPFLSPSILQACRDAGVPVVMRCSNYRLFCPSGTHLFAGRTCERCLGAGRELWCVIQNCEQNLAKSAGYAVRHAVARLGRRITRHVDAYIVLSEFQKQRFMQNGIPEARLTVVPNHTDSGPEPEGNGDQVVFVGRVAPEKGIADFLEMARALPRIPFAVAGAVKETAQPLLQNLPHNVRLLGHLDRPALAALLRESRVMVACSRWYEGFPNAVLDAMAAGLPVLATDMGAMPEIVDHEITGLIYKSGDMVDAVRQLGELYADPQRCAVMGAAGRRKVQRVYDPDTAYAGYMQVLQRVLQYPPAEAAVQGEDVMASCAPS